MVTGQAELLGEEVSVRISYLPRSMDPRHHSMTCLQPHKVSEEAECKFLAVWDSGTVKGAAAEGQRKE